MTRSLPRPCLGCRRPTRRGARCDACSADYERSRPTRALRETAAYRRAVRGAVAEHVAVHGWVCPGDDRHPAHATRDLTADHPLAIVRGGAVDQPLKVLCRSANSRKGVR